MTEVNPMRGKRTPRTPCNCCCADEFCRADEKRAIQKEIQEQLEDDKWVE